MKVIPDMRNLDQQEIKSILLFKEFLNIFNQIKFFLYILTEILVCIVRKNLINEEELSPLLSINYSLNEDLYRNIIKQSQHPENENLFLEYLRISNLSKDSNDTLGICETNFDKTEENNNRNRISQDKPIISKQYE